MNELIAFFNNLSDLFATIISQGRLLYPTKDFPRNPCILIHSSLASFGHVPGGEGTVVAALKTLTQRGDSSLPQMTLMFCAHSDEEPFDLRSTSCRKMGRIPEYIRKMAGTHRSKHPLLSFCACGPKAAFFMAKHSFVSGLGPDSPLGKLYTEDGLILMLGTDWKTCTALHLAEYYNPKREILTCSAAVVDHIGPFSYIRSRTAIDIAFHTENFQEAGMHFEKENKTHILTGELPQGEWKLMRIRDLVDRCTFLR